MNVDAVVFTEVGCVRVGVVIRADKVGVIWACSKLLMVDCNALTAELLAFKGGFRVGGQLRTNCSVCRA